LDKKAAKAAAKAAHKTEEGQVMKVTTTAPPASQSSTKPIPTSAPSKAKIPIIPSKVVVGRMASKVQCNQIVLNPNLPLKERPVVSLTMAIINNTILDFTITPDHLSRHAALGLDDGSTLVGDFAMARYIANRTNSPQSAHINSWMDYAQSLMQLSHEQVLQAVTATLEQALAQRTYLVGFSLSMADLAVFSALGFPAELSKKAAILESIPVEAKATRRWLSMVASAPSVMEATQIATGQEEAVFDEFPLEPLASGMNFLEGGIAGRVVTRFPPEPSGYLHIGHAKAVLLNDYYARRYRGRLIVRFDDTNPSKEKEEFQSSIVEDLAKLGVKPDLITFTSDYFDTITKYAEYLIHNGLAFMDDTPQEQMKEERMQRKDSRHRNQTPDEALKYFKLMCSGSEEGGAWCLRAKIDMQSDNGTMRDPVLFRQNLTPHHRSGSRFKAYPTYDLACPIVDSIEGVTHALRTTEYNDRDAQYQWIQKSLNLRRVRIHAFSRVNFNYTVMSKRKLAWFVDEGLVTGWDDPRFPTIRGVVRRGIYIDALRSFMYSQGASRNIVNMDWSSFWALNKKEIDKIAKRFMAVDKTNHVLMKITNGPLVNSHTYLTTDFHPKDPTLGKRLVRIGGDVFLETVDTEGMVVGEIIVLVRWGVMKILQVDGGLVAEYIPDGDFKNAKRKISWIVDVADNTPCVLTEFDNLVTKDKLEEEDKFEDFVNPCTMAITDVIGDAGLKMLQKNEIIQLERRGYYRVDRPYMGPDKPLILFTVPDGKVKAMGGITGKLAHR
jgi:glutamyl-tRNA synthetase